MVTKATISLPKVSFAVGEPVIATSHDRDPSLFYGWGWRLASPDGGALGGDGTPSPAGETTFEIPYPEATATRLLQQYGSLSIGATLYEFDHAPVWPDDYDNQNWLGTSSAAGRLYLPSTGVATITSANLAEGTPAVTAAAIGRYVQGVSTVSWDIAATGANNVDIASYEITIDGVLYRTQAGTSAVLRGTGTKDVVTKIVDVSGQTQTRTDSIVILPYAPPTITAYNAFRATSAGVESETDTYVRATFSGSASSLLNGTEKNSTTFVLRSRPVGGTFESKGSGTGGLSPTGTFTPSGYDVNTSYEVRLELSDKLTTVAAVTFVSKGGIVLDLGPGNVGIGKEWQQGTLDVAGTMYVENEITTPLLSVGLMIGVGTTTSLTPHVVEAPVLQGPIHATAASGQRVEMASDRITWYKSSNATDAYIGVDEAKRLAVLASPANITARKASGQNFTNAAWTTVTWPTRTNMSGFTYKSSGAFVAPRSGLYLVSVQVAFNASNTSGQRTIRIEVNGVQKFMSQQVKPSDTSYPIAPNITAVVPLSAGDELSIGGYQSSGATLGIDTEEGKTFLSALSQ